MKSLLKPSSTKRILFFVLADLLISLLTLFLAYSLRFNFEVDPKFFPSFWTVYAILASFKIAAMYFFKSYFIVWRFFSFEDIKNILKAHLVAYMAFTLLYLVDDSLFIPFSRSAFAIDFFLSFLMIATLRSGKRFVIGNDYVGNMKPTLIIGANTKTTGLIRSALDGEIAYYPVAVIAGQGEEGIIGSYINNIKVYDFKALEEVVHHRGIEAVIIASQLSQQQLKVFVDYLNGIGISEIKRVKLLENRDEKLEDLSIEDLLARHPKDLDTETIAAFIENKRVLITGAGGSIGSEIVRQCKHFGTSALALLDHSEYNLYQIGEEVPEAMLDMLSVTNRRLLDEKMQAFRPDIVIHAAAYKHVPLCEANKEAAVQNNVSGTKNVIDASIAAEVEKLVIISTDKAVRPTNVMGTTKRVTELYAQNVDSKQTEIVAVRFGNVLGSSGSVIPKFKQQIEMGGPVTVTHAEMTRYFMLIPEACQLVLQAAAIAKGGELFILDMGEPVKILDLARQMIRLYGKEDEVEIVFSGLRPGEKLYEELLIDETEKKTQYSSIFIAGKTDYAIDILEKDIEVLLNANDKVTALKKIVPEFEHKP